MKKSTLRRVDLVFSIVLIILSAFVFINSISIFFNPFGRDFEDVQPEAIKQSIVQWYKSPALFPMLLAVVLLLLALMLFANAKKEGARFDFIKREKLTRFLQNKELSAFIIIATLLITYVFALLPLCRRYLNLFPRFQGFPFMIGTFIFMSVFMIIFNEKTQKKIVTSLLIAGCASVIITYVFGNMVLIPLP